MYFADRYAAARQLASHLEKYKHENGIILAVPRGGVPTGYYLAKHLDFPLDLLMTQKMRHPLQEDYAIGAVGLEHSIIEQPMGVSPEYIEQEISRIRLELAERYKTFMGTREPASLLNKTVIITDDGMTTGRTMLAAIKMLKGRHPKRLVLAVPVASRQAALRVKQEVDDFICLYTPASFTGVGRFYADFSQTTDEEVMRLLRELNARNHAA